LVENSEGQLFLITNRHVVTGRHNFTNIPLCKNPAEHQAPQELKVSFSEVNQIGLWFEKTYPLYDKSHKKLYYEYEVGNGFADFIALKIEKFPKLGNMARNYQSLQPNKHILAIQDKVAVLGYSFGKTVRETFNGLDANFPIWSTGFVASEANIDADNRPVFFIDCRTKPGQSGSPVIASQYKPSPHENEDGTIEIVSVQYNLFGIYSGRIANDSDIGMVWKTSAIVDLIENI